MQVILRRATSSDAAAVAELFLRARRAGSATGSTPPLAHVDDDVRLWVAHAVIPGLDCWLAERVSGPVAGMLVLEGDWIRQLYVDPDLTRAGIGAELMALAQRERPEGLRLWTFVSNDRAQRSICATGSTKWNAPMAAITRSARQPSSMRGPPDSAQDARIGGPSLRAVIGQVERGDVSPNIDGAYRLEQTADARRRMAANEATGKLVVLPHSVTN